MALWTGESIKNYFFFKLMIKLNTIDYTHLPGTNVDLFSLNAVKIKISFLE